MNGLSAVLTTVVIVIAGCIFLACYRNEEVVAEPECRIEYSENFSASDYAGVVTIRAVGLKANKMIRVLENSEIAGERAKALFGKFREPPMNKLPACVDEGYRLTWLPTFHALTTVRVWRSGDKYFIDTKRLRGKGGYEIGDIEVEQLNALTSDEWQSFQSLINNDSFWTEPPIIDEVGPNDGATWIFEGIKYGKYHCINRLRPSKELEEVLRKLFTVTGVNTEYELYL